MFSGREKHVKIFFYTVKTLHEIFRSSLKNNHRKYILIVTPGNNRFSATLQRINSEMPKTVSSKTSFAAATLETNI